MAQIIKLTDRPTTLDEAWRIAELYGDIRVDDGLMSDPKYRVQIYGKTPAGSTMWATGKGHDILSAICNAVEEAHNHGVQPR